MRRWRPIWRWIRFRLLYVALTLLSRLPRRLGLKLFGGAGVLTCRLLSRPRTQVIDNTRLVFPAWSPERRSKFAREVFRWVGRNGFDFVRLSGYSAATIQDLVLVRGLENLAAAHGRGR
ncbi:MAG: hypothetical protein GY778_26345, partial [bacterium]|nr:hypothetical protein [bacterium]